MRGFGGELWEVHFPSFFYPGDHPLSSWPPCVQCPHEPLINLFLPFSLLYPLSLNLI